MNLRKAVRFMIYGASVPVIGVGYYFAFEKLTFYFI